MFKTVAPCVVAAALLVWGYGVYEVLAGDSGRGLVLAGIGAAVVLVYAWTRRAFWLPDGGGGP